MHPVQIALDVFLIGIASFSSLTDLLKRKIYDWVTIPGLLAGLILRWFAFGLGEGGHRPRITLGHLG